MATAADVLAEADPAGNTLNEYTFFGGKRVAVIPAGGSPTYYVEDLLGTSRVLTTNTGVVCYDADFYPFGGERAYTNTCATRVIAILDCVKFCKFPKEGFDPFT